MALSEAFQQPDLQPAHASVFTQSVRNMIMPPLMTQGAELQALVKTDLEDLLTTPYFEDLQASLRAIDEKSRSLLDPDYEPSEPPSESAPGSASGSPSGSASVPSDTVTDDRSRD